MKDLLKTIRLGMLLFALPLVATAAATAHQFATDSSPVDLDSPASVSADTPDTLAAILRKHTIKMNREGSVQGRITGIQSDRQAVGLAELNVFFVQDGEIVNQTKTNSDGEFLVEGMSEGAYSFVATGENGFAAYGVQVVANSGSDQPNNIEASAVSPKFSVVQEILDNRVPEEITEEIQQLASRVQPNDVVSSNRVLLNNGQLSGNVIPIWGQRQSVDGTYVHIIKDDVKVAETQVNAKGEFTIDNIEPGIYDFVAAGPSGFAAVSFEAVQDVESVVEEVTSLDDIAIDVLDEAIDSEEVPVAIPDSASLPLDAAQGSGTSAPIISQGSGSSFAPSFDSGSSFIDSGSSFASPGFSNSLDVCTTCPQDGFVVDNSFVGNEVFSQPVSSPIEYAGEFTSVGGACGGSCGSAGNFSNFASSCGSCGSCCGGGGGGGGFLSRFGSGGGNLRRVLLLGAIAGGIVAIADDDDSAGTPPPVSPF